MCSGVEGAGARSSVGAVAHIGGALLTHPPLRPHQAQDMHLLLAIATFIGAATVCIINILYKYVFKTS